MDNRLYWIWLAQHISLGNGQMNVLLDTFGNAAAVYAATAEELSRAGIRESVCQRLSDKSLEEPERLLARTLSSGDFVLTPEDVTFPPQLREIYGCPAVLYCRGKMPDWSTKPFIALVGTRHASEEGVQSCSSLAAGLAAGGAVVVSGGAVGIDAAAHRGAMLGGGPTVMVTGAPLNVPYPRQNSDLRDEVVESGGLLISEYPPDRPYRCIFPIRNRLISGISHGVCLVQTPQKSGARITAHLAQEQGRDVFAVPDTVTGHHNDGAHDEIRAGAILVTRASEILEEYTTLFPQTLSPEAADEQQGFFRSSVPPVAEEPPPEEDAPSPEPSPREFLPPPPDLSAQAARVLPLLGAVPRAVDDLSAEAGMSVHALLAVLTELEMAGCVRSEGINRYCRQ